MTTNEKKNLFGMKIDAVTMPMAIEKILGWCHEKDPCRYVVTPNVDHVVMYQTRGDLRQAYNDAALVLADGAPVIWASRLLRRSLPERVAGSDLVPALFESAANQKETQSPLRVFLLGAAPGVGQRAAAKIRETWANVEVVGCYSPPMGFENDPSESKRIYELIAEADPQVLLLGLGAPKQELWVQRHAAQLQARVALCVGATIDFLAGEKSRSPRWMRKVGLEWLHRLSTEPTRLARRYFRDAWIFPQLVWREWRGARA